MPLNEETNNNKIGKYTYIEATNTIKDIVEGTKALNFNWRPGVGDGRALEKINEIFCNEIFIKSNYEFLFRGSFSLGASDETVCALPNPPLKTKDRMENQFKPRYQKYALATYSQPMEAMYEKLTIFRGEFETVSHSPQDIAKFEQQKANQAAMSEIRTKNAIGLRHINNAVDFILKTEDKDNAEIFDVTKDYQDYYDKEDLTHPQYLKKDKQGSAYGVIMHAYTANSAASWDEAITNGNLIEFNTISYIARPGSGSTSDEIKRNCELFLKYLQKLLLSFTMTAKEGNTLSGVTNSNDLTKMKLLLLINPHILPELNVEVLNKYNVDFMTKFAANFEIQPVEKFENTRVYALLCDYDYILIKQGRAHAGVDISHEGGFANYTHGNQFWPKIQFHKYVHLFMDPDTSSKKI